MTCQGDHSSPACCSTPKASASQNYLCGAWHANGTSMVYSVTNVTSAPASTPTNYVCNNVNASGSLVPAAADGRPASELLLPACCSPTAPLTALQSAAASQASPSVPSGSSGSSPTGAIVGGVVGGVAALAVLSAIGSWCFYCQRRRRQRSKQNADTRSSGRLQVSLTNPWATSSHPLEGTSSRTGAHTSSQSLDTHTWSDQMFRPPATEGGMYGVMQLSGGWMQMFRLVSQPILFSCGDWTCFNM